MKNCRFIWRLLFCRQLQKGFCRALSPLTIALIMLSMGLPASALGTITQVPSRRALDGNDSVDWAQLPQPYVFLPSTFPVTSSNGLTAQVSGPGELFSDRKGNPQVGNFGLGDFLVEAKNYLEITFAQPVRGIGAQVGHTFCNCPLVAHLVLFDSSHNILASLISQGTESDAEDNSAIFIGAIDSEAEIKSAMFYAGAVTPELGGDTFAVNRLDLVTSSPMPANALVVRFPKDNTSEETTLAWNNDLPSRSTGGHMIKGGEVGRIEFTISEFQSRWTSGSKRPLPGIG